MFRYTLTAVIVVLLISNMLRGRNAVEYRFWNRFVDIGIVFAAGKQTDTSVNMWAVAIGVTIVDYVDGLPRFWEFSAAVE